MRIISALFFVLLISIALIPHAFTQEDDDATIRAAVEKTIPLLQGLGPTFIEKTGCTSCHHNSLPAMAIGLARERGFKIDEGVMRENSAATLPVFAQHREQMLQGIQALPNMAITASYTLLGLAASKQPADRTTDAIVHHLLRRQEKDGCWRSTANRPPLEYSDVTATALTLRALQLYPPQGQNEEVKRRVGRAREWLVVATPKTSEERVFQLLGLGWANARKSDIEKAVKGLLAEQRADGGWAQLSTLESDAYATGQAIVALHQAGGLRVTDPACRRGIKFLLKTQFNDGSWLVLTRALPVQRYFESGFPHGKNQFISAAGTAWAAMALTLTIESPKRMP